MELRDTSNNGKLKFEDSDIYSEVGPPCTVESDTDLSLTCRQKHLLHTPQVSGEYGGSSIEKSMFIGAPASKIPQSTTSTNGRFLAAPGHKRYPWMSENMDTSGVSPNNYEVPIDAQARAAAKTGMQQQQGDSVYDIPMDLFHSHQQTTIGGRVGDVSVVEDEDDYTPMAAIFNTNESGENTK